MDRLIFETYVETQLAPTLKPLDDVALFRPSCFDRGGRDFSNFGRNANKLAQSLLAFALSAALIAEPAMAQAQDNPAAPTAPATDAEANAAEPAAGESFSRDELEKLLAPIALYPDPLLAQMLPASAYPVQIVQAQRWLDKNKALVAKNDYSGIDNQNWDPAVKALARFPDVIKLMSADLDWTTDLGDAGVNQPQDVAEVIQDLRAKAEAAGTLKTTALELRSPQELALESRRPADCFEPQQAGDRQQGLRPPRKRRDSANS
jgi:hypothetical protein